LEKAQALYLLHGIAWPPKDIEPIGTIVVVYEDGSSHELSVVNRKDVANWWQPFDLENGIVAWQGENHSSTVGLHLSKFLLENKPIKELKFTGTGKAVWIVVGVSIGDSIPLVKEYTIIENNEWKPFNHKLGIKKDSIFDFSSLLDGPAGKHGRIVVKNGCFEFESKPGTRVKLFGCNLCYQANFLSKTKCEQVAETISRSGYNSVRLHHIDKFLGSQPPLKSTQIDADMQDKLDYLFFCLKNKGIYITIDLYTDRLIKAGDIPEIDKDIRIPFEYFCLVSENARNNWKEYSRNLLTHKNPYTGMTWAEDPALFQVGILNEDTIYDSWDKIPEAKRLFENKFTEYLEKNNIKVKDDISKKQVFVRFLSSLHSDMIQYARLFFKEINLKAIVSDVNFMEPICLSAIRKDLDVVDNHQYWDHPVFLDKDWQLPFKYKNTSTIKELAETPRSIMPSRIFGSPFTVTEYNYCYPNSYRAEGGVLMGAYSALQDWDAIYRFDYSTRDYFFDKVYPTYRFSIATDPVGILSEKIACMMFLRGDIAPASKAIPFILRDSKENPLAGMKERYPKEYSLLGLYSKIGTVIYKDGDKMNLIPSYFACGLDNMSSLPVAYYKAGIGFQELLEGIPLQKTGRIDFQGKSFESDTGEIAIDAVKGSFKAFSKRIECFCLPANTQAKGQYVFVSNGEAQSVISVTSMDGKNLPDSRRILILHIKDTQNSQIKFRGTSRTVLEDWGTLPILVRKGKATVNISFLNNRKTILKPLEIDGSAMRQINMTGAEYNLSTFNEFGTCLAYEIEVLE